MFCATIVYEKEKPLCFATEKNMIGIYDYTVILTYMSLLSAVSGVALTMNGHPIIATLCLLFCGFCDMFDGKVARTKKNRTDEEKSYGIQIDSLSDIVAFGVLPAAISISLCRARWYVIVFAAFFVLAGLIRLAYFNVTEEQRQQETDECRKTYTGLPITASALIFPLFFCIISGVCLYFGDITRFSPLFDRWGFQAALCGLLGVTGLLYILPFRLRKPQSREMWLMLGVGALIALFLLAVLLRKALT